MLHVMVLIFYDCFTLACGQLSFDARVGVKTTLSRIRTIRPKDCSNLSICIAFFFCSGRSGK